jgi:hypothetical protein
LGYFLRGTTCGDGSICLDGTYPDTITKSCVGCDGKCSTCFGGADNECYSCSGSYKYADTLKLCTDSKNINI